MLLAPLWFFSLFLQSAENDTLRFRVAVAQLPIQYVQLVTDRVKGQERGFHVMKEFEAFHAELVAEGNHLMQPLSG